MPVGPLTLAAGGGGSGRPFAVGWEARSLAGARVRAPVGRYIVQAGAPAGAYPGTRSRLA